MRDSEEGPISVSNLARTINRFIAGVALISITLIGGCYALYRSHQPAARATPAAAEGAR